jgi:hypothetical protein
LAFKFSRRALASTFSSGRDERKVNLGASYVIEVVRKHVQSDMPNDFNDFFIRKSGLVPSLVEKFGDPLQD